MALERVGQHTEMIGRVMEATVARFSAECYRLHQAPDLGCLVVVEEPRGEIYAVVCEVATTSIEPGRRPVAHMPPEADADAILAENPHLPLLLRTTFEALVVGYEEDGIIRQHLPPSPPRIYARIQPCSIPLLRQLTSDFQFLKLLLLSGRGADEVTAACLRQAAAAHEDPKAFSLRAGKALLVLLAQEPERLTGILRSIQL